MRTGLILGAGGIVGQAYHAGVLASFAEAGWDARSADVVVGSSAGSVTGSLLRLGLSAQDLAAWATDGTVSPEGAELLDALGQDLPELPPPSLSDFVRGWRLPSRALIARAARRPWAFRPGVAAITLMPSGKIDIRQRAEVLDRDGDRWPEGLWICAARRHDGRRVVFGRPGAPEARLSDAVAASCAIPGYLAPVQIGRSEYIDGGVHSPTNADVLAPLGLDIVVVVSPMSSHGVVRSPDAAMRWSARRRLDREVARLRAAGTQVIRVEPTQRVIGSMGLNAMADDRTDRVVEAGRRQAAALLQRENLTRRLNILVESGAGQVAA